MDKKDKVRQNNKLLSQVNKYFKPKKSRKKYLIKPINFGGVEEPARILIEKYMEQNGGSVSKLVRDIVVNYLSNKKEYKDHKINLLIEQRKKMNQEVQRLSKELQKNADDLERKGINMDKINEI